MGLIVQKFGGSSVRDAERIMHVAGIVTDTYSQGNDVIVVVSAQGSTTDDLIAKAEQITDNPSRREMDMLLSTGEQISVSLLAMAIHKLGYRAKSLTGWQIGIHTNSNHTNARIKRIDKERLENELSKKNIIIAAGFQGVNKYDDVSTLGRGGSDTSAVALAAALHADKCQIFTDVDGVYTADPRLVKTAKKIDEITYDEMLEMATLGAQVLHNRSVEMAKKYNVNLEVLSSFENKRGTMIKEVVAVENMLIKGVTRDNDVARISVVGLPDKPGIAFKLFSLLSAKKINVDIILQSIGRHGTKDISFTVTRPHKQMAMDIINENKAILGAEDIICEDNISKISIVGAGMQTNPGVAAKMFEALGEANINIEMISTSEIKISVLIDINESEKALNVVHEAFAI